MLSRVVADVDAVQDLLVGIALPIATGLLTASVAVALEALMVPGAGQLLAAGLVLDGIVVPLIGWRLGVRAASSLAAARGRVATVVVESLHGAADLVAFGARDHALGTLDGAEQTLARGLRRSASASGWAQALGGVVAGATTIGIVALGSSAVAHRAGALGHPSPVAVAVAAFVSLAAFDAIAAMPDAVVRLHTALGAAHRIRELDTRTPPVASPDAPRPIRAGDDTYVLKDVSVPYAPDGPAVLEHIDLEITPGKRLAVVGTSGAGKTTLALALLRFLDLRTGRATYGGCDVRDVAPDDIRARIAWAPQDPHIFGTTVAANLRVARPDASDDELVAALVALGLDEWLAQLPGGLATEVGERGQRMSGGERQRLGVARALLADRPILLLDEPTAHLDEEGAATVRRAVRQADRATTAVVWITHRLADVDDFDEVVVLEHGRVVDRGRADDLRRAAGPSARLWADAAR